MGATANGLRNPIDPTVSVPLVRFSLAPRSLPRSSRKPSLHAGRRNCTATRSGARLSKRPHLDVPTITPAITFTQNHFSSQSQRNLTSPTFTSPAVIATEVTLCS